MHNNSLSPLTRHTLHAGLLLILLAVLRLLFELCATSALCAARAAQFGEMLEYIVMAMALLTAGTYLIEKVVRTTKKTAPTGKSGLTGRFFCAAGV